jgi:hypothetical protein
LYITPPFDQHQLTIVDLPSNIFKMVTQRGIPLLQKDDFQQQRPGNFAPIERAPDFSYDARFHSTSTHPRVLSVEAALRDCARIPVKDFALIVTSESGELQTYTSQILTQYQSRIFTDRFKEDFVRHAGKANLQGCISNPAYNQDASMYSDREGDGSQQYSGDSSSGTRQHHFRQGRFSESEGDESGNSSRRRKRRRQRQLDEDDNPAPVLIQKTQRLVIGDEDEVYKFYLVRFKDMQQSACKVMGKAFVKLVEPKKQTHHPYTKGNAHAPSWWPITAGEDQVRHKEPDHLLKPERIRLLIHILRMIVEPYPRQHPSVQKLKLNIKKLEEITMEAMSNWFNDKDHPENAKKKPYLKEIFKVAHLEARVKANELDADSSTYVMCGDKSTFDLSDDDEPDEGMKMEDEEQREQLPASSNMPTPESMVSPQGPGMGELQQRADNDNRGVFSMRQPEMQFRYHPQQPQIGEGSSYADSFPRSMGGGLQQSPDLHDPYRRSFASPGYQSPQPNMYGWQNNMGNVSAGPSPSNNFFVTASPQTTITAPAYQLPPPHPQLTLPPAHYDGMPNRPYDGGPGIGTQLRTGSLGHPHHMPQHHGFQDFLHDHGGYGHNDDGMKDDQSHNMHQV